MEAMTLYRRNKSAEWSFGAGMLYSDTLNGLPWTRHGASCMMQPPDGLAMSAEF